MATTYKRGNAKVLTWVDAAGKQQRRSLGKISQRAADAKRVAKEAELLKGAAPPRAPTFRQFSETYLQWYEHEYPASWPRVSQIVGMHLSTAFSEDDIDTISPFKVEQYKASRGRLVSTGTVSKELLTLKAMLNAAVNWELISRSPIAKVKPPQILSDAPVAFYSVTALSSIYNAATPIHGACWKLLANTGMRRSEAMQLKRTELTENEIRVISQTGARTKSAKWRAIPISTGARDALITLRDADPVYVLPRMAPPSFSREFARDAVVAKVGGNLHRLRHTFISHLVMKGVPLRTVQVLAGHSTIRMTERYAHLAPDYLKDVMEGFEL